MVQERPQVNEVWEFSNKQTHARKTLEDPTTKELLYGGAKGGGKSVFLCRYAYLYADHIIRTYHPQGTYAIPIGFIGRKRGVDFSHTTLETWKRFIPSHLYKINEQRHEIIIGPVKYYYGGLDDEDVVNKFNSAEFGLVIIDQAEEMSQEDMGYLRGTLNRLKINGQEIPYKVLLSANPRICWLKDEFLSRPEAGTRFIQALPSDNPFLPDGYVSQLQKAFKNRPELLKAYLYGSWDELEGDNVVIPMSDVQKNVENDQHNELKIKRITYADIAEFGDDETVIYDMVNTKIVNTEIYTHRDLMDTCGRIIAHGIKNKSNIVGCDVIGLGAGVFSRLNEVLGARDDMAAYGFDSRVKARDSETYANKKSEAWFEAANLMRERRCDIPNDPILIGQLSSMTYDFGSNGKIHLTPKDKIKKNLGSSPDRADCYVMALSMLEDVAQAVEKHDRYTKHKSFYRFNPETC